MVHRKPINKVVTKDSKIELEKLHQIVDQFINSCSHSMRGPIKSIDGLVGLLQNNPQYNNEEACVLLNLILSNTNRMEHLLDELEQFLQNHKRRLANRAVDAKELIEEVLENFDVLMSERKITVQLDVDQKEELYTDTNRLRLILANLVDNAIRFHHCKTEHKWVAISAKINKKNYSITIKDNGVGIPKEYYENIDKPFFRGSSKSNGFGMGLYLVRELITKMNGTISISSNNPVGSSIEIVLPNITKNTR